MYGILQSKKATVVLLWSALIHIYYIFFFINTHTIKHGEAIRDIISGVFLLLYPISGWLADVYITRYKAMFSGTVCAIIGTMISIIITFTKPQLLLIGFVIATIGHTFFEVNAILFGLDQLQMYSTDNQRSFIYWFYWTMEFGRFLYGICVCGSIEHIGPQEGIKITSTVFSVVQIIGLIIAAVFVFVWKRKFVNNTTGYHPFKLIFQVVKYVSKTRLNIKRKDITSPTTLDLAKFKYGGSFTTEQVEDVKVFFYLLFILSPLSIIYYTDEIYTIATQFQPVNRTTPENIGQCLLTEVPNWMRSAVAAILLPAYIMIISPILYRITHYLWLLWRLGIGMCFTLLAAFSLFGIELAVALHEIKNDSISTTSNCYVGETISFNWLIIPELLNGISLVIIFSTTLEFICAQSPSSIKGFLICIWFAFQGINKIIVGIQEIRQLDCYFGYHIGKAIVIIGFITLYVFAARYYRYRRRQDFSSREILENYFEVKPEDSYENDDGNNSDLSYSIKNIMTY